MIIGAHQRTSYNSILYDQPKPINELKPYLYATVRCIIQQNLLPDNGTGQEVPAEEVCPVSSLLPVPNRFQPGSFQENQTKPCPARWRSVRPPSWLQTQLKYNKEQTSLSEEVCSFFPISSRRIMAEAPANKKIRAILSHLRFLLFFQRLTLAGRRSAVYFQNQFHFRQGFHFIIIPFCRKSFPLGNRTPDTSLFFQSVFARFFAELCQMRYIPVSNFQKSFFRSHPSLAEIRFSFFADRAWSF